MKLGKKFSGKKTSEKKDSGRKTLSLRDFGAQCGIEIQEKDSQPDYSNYKEPSRNFGGGRGGKNYSGYQRNYNNNKKQKKSNTPKNIGDATAAYNFVALPSKPLPSPLDENRTLVLNDDDKVVRKNFREYILGGEKLSGEIILYLETLTPMFIGGNADNFFAPTGEPIIAGSSLRGMFKNIFKIVTLGTMRGRTSTQRKGEDINDERVYFRCLMAPRSSPDWMKDLRDLYVGRMMTETENQEGKTVLVKNAKPGFLIKTTKGKYFIAPSMYTSDLKDDRILIKEYEDKFNETIELRGSSCVKWDGRIAYIITGSEPEKNLIRTKEDYDELKKREKKNLLTESESKLLRNKQWIRYTKIDYVDWSVGHRLTLDDDVLSSYRHDRNRKGVDLLKHKQGILNRDWLLQMVNNLPTDVESLIPCHYLQEDGQVTAFGHGQCFRIPYRKSIADAVPKSFREKTIDFADAVFGRESFWSSRVYFEDAKPSGHIEFLPKDKSHPLMQPNPTSYQLYLKQPPKKPDLSNFDLNHWDKDDAQIRGYKMYWHNATADWHANQAELDLDKDKEGDKILCKSITPIKDHSNFKSRIRFKNLTAIELGALMMIFDLNGSSESAAYKLGMGKSIGMGSVKISATLRLENDNAYSDLFDGDGWNNPYGDTDAKEYIDAFKNYVDDCGLTEDWLNVMQELNAILNWDNTKRDGWDKKVKSMSGDVQSGSVDERFKHRIPLPSILEVVK